MLKEKKLVLLWSLLKTSGETLAVFFLTPKKTKKNCFYKI